MARPRSRTQEQDEKLFKKFEKYINDTTLPIIAEFAYMNEVDRNYLYDNAIFSTLLKRSIAKKEANLEKGAERLRPARLNRLRRWYSPGPRPCAGVL